jgi:predicted methyltransferase
MGHLGVDRASMNRAILGAQEGGIFVVADHAGRPGTGNLRIWDVHRIEESSCARKSKAAGIRLQEQGMFTQP